VGADRGRIAARSRPDRCHTSFGACRCRKRQRSRVHGHASISVAPRASLRWGLDLQTISMVALPVIAARFAATHRFRGFTGVHGVRFTAGGFAATHRFRPRHGRRCVGGSISADRCHTSFGASRYRKRQRSSSLPPSPTPPRGIEHDGGRRPESACPSAAIHDPLDSTASVPAALAPRPGRSALRDVGRPAAPHGRTQMRADLRSTRHGHPPPTDGQP